jgi:hypothetical protein
MEVRKKNYISTVVTIIFILAVLILFYSILGGKSYIKIRNQTNTTLSGIMIEYIYSNKETIIKIPDIQPKDNYKMKLSFPNDFTEGSIKMNYIDKYGVEQEEGLVGYIEKGYHEKVTVTVNSIDKAGILTLKIH